LRFAATWTLALFFLQAPLSQTPTSSLEGVALRADSGEPIANVQVSLTRAATPPAPSSSGTTNIPRNYNAETGAFEFRDLPPGPYWFRASESASTSQGPRMTALKSLNVTGNLEGVVLELSPGLSITGNLRVDGQALPATALPRITLRPAKADQPFSSGIESVNPDGTFTLTGVELGEYRLTVLSLPVGYFLKEVRIDQTDILNDPWVITGPVRGRLNVVVSSGAGQIEGSVLDNRLQPVSAVQTVLIPDQHRDRTELFKTAVTDQNGKFSLRGIAPGNYKIFSWEALEPNSFFDPEVLRRFEDQGKALRVTEGGKLTTDIRMIPAPTP
jgi:hypothetical protein